MNVANESSPAPSLRRLPFLIRLAPQFLNSLSAVLQENDASGEMNGLLFGLVESDFAVVQVFRLFSSHRGGDQKAGSKPVTEEPFHALMARLKTEPELAGLSLLGWFSARSLGGLQPDDVAFHQKNFRQRNDIAMIVKSESASGLSFEIYCRCLDGTLFDEGHRCGTVRVSNGSPVVAPVEVLMRAKSPEDLYLRAYEISEGVEEDERVAGWKDTLASKTKKAFELLKAAKSEDNGGSAV